MTTQRQRDVDMDALRERAVIASRHSEELIARTKELLAKSQALVNKNTEATKTESHDR